MEELERDKVLPLVPRRDRLYGPDAQVENILRKQQESDWERVKPLVEAAREFLRLYPYQFSREAHYIPRYIEVQPVDMDAIALALAQLGVEVSDGTDEAL